MPGYGRPYWSERTPAARRRSWPAFRGADHADVVVIGGGLTGCTAAYVFAQAGLSVVLLEGAKLASGSTAGSLGVILPQPDALFRSVEAAAGIRVARAAWKNARRSALEFASALRKLPIRCDLAPAPFLLNARRPEAATSLRREQAARKNAGIDAPWLSAPVAAAETGTESAGAIRLRDGFVFDPVRAALGLAGAAEDRGARIFEKSMVRRTRFTRRFADVLLPAGGIRARSVFVATGGPTGLFGQLRRHVREQTAYAVVTEPLPAAMRRETGRRSAVVAEAGAARWLRWLSGDRALFAGGLSKPLAARQRDRVIVARTAELMYELSVRYPIISGLPARWGWSVPVITTADGLPWIGPHRNYPFHFFAMAFGWHGDSLAWFAARAALRSLRGEATRDDQVFAFTR